MTDYKHPPDWESYTNKEKSNWYLNERCRRQTLRQNTTTARMLRKKYEKLHRKLEAHPDTVEVKR
jgi:hypothetical protein